MIVTCCNRKFRMTHIFWFDQYKKGFSFIFLQNRKMIHHLAYVKKWWWENFPLDTIFLSKLWQVFWKLQLIENDDQTMIFFSQEVWNLEEGSFGFTNEKVLLHTLQSLSKKLHTYFHTSEEVESFIAHRYSKISNKQVGLN